MTVTSDCEIDTLVETKTTDSFENTIPLVASMSAVNQAFTTYTQNKKGGGLCYYKISYTFKVSTVPDDLSSYS